MASGEQDSYEQDSYEQDSYDYGYTEKTATASATVSNSSSSREPFRFTSSHLQEPDVVSYRHDVGTRSDGSDLPEVKTSTAIDRMVGSTTKVSGDDAYTAIGHSVDQPRVDHHRGGDQRPSSIDRLRLLEESHATIAAILQKFGHEQQQVRHLLSTTIDEQNQLRSSVSTMLKEFREFRASQQVLPVFPSGTPSPSHTPSSSFSTPQSGGMYSPAQDATLMSRAMAKDFTPIRLHVKKLEAGLRGTPKGVLAFANLRRGLENYAAERGTLISSMPCVKLEEFLDPGGWEFSKLERAKFRNPGLTVGEALSMIEKPWSSSSCSSGVATSLEKRWAGLRQRGELRLFVENILSLRLEFYSASLAMPDLKRTRTAFLDGVDSAIRPFASLWFQSASTTDPEQLLESVVEHIDQLEVKSPGPAGDRGRGKKASSKPCSHCHKTNHLSDQCLSLKKNHNARKGSACYLHPGASHTPMRIVGLNAATVEDITMMTSVLKARIATALRKRASVTRRSLRLLTIFDSFFLRWPTGRQTCLMPYPLMILFCRPSANSLLLKVSSGVSRDPRTAVTLFLMLPLVILLLRASSAPMIVAFHLASCHLWSGRASSRFLCLQRPSNSKHYLILVD